MQRAWVEEHFGTGEQRRKETDGQAERVEQRQRGHKAIVGGEVGNCFDLLYVRQNAFVTVNNAFRVAL